MQPDDAGGGLGARFDFNGRFVARPGIHAYSVFPAIDTTGRASLAHNDFGKHGQCGLELAPDPASEVFAGGVLQTFNLV